MRCVSCLVFYWAGGKLLFCKSQEWRNSWIEISMEFSSAEGSTLYQSKLVRVKNLLQKPIWLCGWPPRICCWRRSLNIFWKFEYYFQCCCGLCYWQNMCVFFLTPLNTAVCSLLEAHLIEFHISSSLSRVIYALKLLEHFAWVNSILDMCVDL